MIYVIEINNMYYGRSEKIINGSEESMVNEFNRLLDLATNDPDSTITSIYVKDMNTGKYIDNYCISLLDYRMNKEHRKYLYRLQDRGIGVDDDYVCC